MFVEFEIPPVVLVPVLEPRPLSACVPPKPPVVVEVFPVAAPVLRLPSKLVYVSSDHLKTEEVLEEICVAGTRYLLSKSAWKPTYSESTRGSCGETSVTIRFGTLEAILSREDSPSY